MDMDPDRPPRRHLPRRVETTDGWGWEQTAVVGGVMLFVVAAVLYGLLHFGGQSTGGVTATPTRIILGAVGTPSPSLTPLPTATPVVVVVVVTATPLPAIATPPPSPTAAPTATPAPATPTPSPARTAGVPIPVGPAVTQPPVATPPPERPRASPTRPAASPTPRPAAQPTATATAGPLMARVVGVLDGSTIKVDPGDGNIQTVRYIGVDAPGVNPPDPATECYGPQANARNADLVKDHTVRLEPGQPAVDAQGRWLRYVYLGDTFVNVQLIREGMAAANPPADSPHANEMRAAEQQARQDKNGLWATCGGPHAASTTPVPRG